MISFTSLFEQRCQETICDGIRWLNAEEQADPATCMLCKKKVCDQCCFGVRIPHSVLGVEPDDWGKHYQRCQGMISQFREHMLASQGWCPHTKPTDDQRYDALVCSDCFQEKWVA